MSSLLSKNYDNFAMLVQIIRQNLQNPENSEFMELILNKGFPNFLEQVLNDILPINFETSSLINVDVIQSIINSFDHKTKNQNDIIQSRSKFFQSRKKRIMLLDILMSLVLIRKKILWDLFFGKNQESQDFQLFKKVVVWQVLSQEVRERQMLDQLILFLFFDSLPESILTNKTVSFGLNRKNFNRRNGICYGTILRYVEQYKLKSANLLISGFIRLVYRIFIKSFRTKKYFFDPFFMLPCNTH
jgi:hypothetical protein